MRSVAIGKMIDRLVSGREAEDGRPPVSAATRCRCEGRCEQDRSAPRLQPVRTSTKIDI